MAKQFLKRYMPDDDVIKRNRWLRLCLDYTERAQVLHFNRRSASRAILIGLFCAFIPLPIQMFLAFILCVWMRANLPLTMGMVWLTNPLTIAPVFLATYHLGAFLMQQPTIGFEFEMSWQWLEHQFALVWKPLMLGSLVTGTVLACVGYTVVEISWRRHTLRKWQSRNKRSKRRLRNTHKS